MPQKKTKINQNLFFRYLMGFGIIIITAAGVNIYKFATKDNKQHKNVVKVIYDDCLFITDLETNQNRIIELKKAHGKDIKFICPGDTVDVSAVHYDNKIFVHGFTHIKSNEQVIKARKDSIIKQQKQR